MPSSVTLQHMPSLRWRTDLSHFSPVDEKQEREISEKGASVSVDGAGVKEARYVRFRSFLFLKRVYLQLASSFEASLELAAPTSGSRFEPFVFSNAPNS